MAQQVIWNGDDVNGFYTSHMTHGLGRHTQPGSWGKPTGRTYLHAHRGGLHDPGEPHLQGMDRA